eukprot:8202777-Lingulodinium_polyedra.AAC.1
MPTRPGLPVVGTERLDLGRPRAGEGALIIAGHAARLPTVGGDLSCRRNLPVAAVDPVRVQRRRPRL